MALDEIPQLDEVDDVLDGLASPSSLEVYEAMLPYDDGMVTAAAAQRAVNGGGGGGGSLPDGWVANDPAPTALNAGGGTLLNVGTLSAVSFQASPSAPGDTVFGAGDGKITGLAEGTDPSDAATVSQLGGGSQPVTDSWLVVTDTAPVTEDGLIPWSLTGSDGADIAVNGGDSTKIDILTTGVYVISFAPRFSGDATGAGYIQVGFFGDFGGFMDAGGVSKKSPEIVPPSFESYDFITSLPIPVTAPLQVAINAGFTTNAGEISIEGVLTIVRLF